MTVIALSPDTIEGLLRAIAQSALTLPNLWVFGDIVEAASNLKEFKKAPYFAEA